MVAYVKREGGKRFGAAGGKPSFGARSGKPSFAKKSWGDRSSGPITHHKATCTTCGKPCEVPFKPMNGKPVFCREHFVKTGDTGAGRAGDRYPKREFQPRTFASPAPAGGNSDDVLKQLEMMNAKLERLIRAVEASFSPISKKQ
jgi:CxxC-x17-CxxC domain-containing protein